MHDTCVYTVQEVANLLKVSIKTVYNLVRDGDLASIRVRGQIRITSLALDEYISRGGEQDERKHQRDMVP